MGIYRATSLKHCFNIVITHKLIVDIFIIRISDHVAVLVKLLRFLYLLVLVQHFNFGLTFDVSNTN